MKIQLSEHFTYKKLIKFTLPTIAMMIFTSIYGVVDGLFISNVVGSNAFASVNLMIPAIMIIGTIIINWFNIFASSFFTALNNGFVSALISFLRTLLFQVVTILVLPNLLGINGIWLSVLVAEILTIVVSIICFIKNKKKYEYA